MSNLVLPEIVNNYNPQGNVYSLKKKKPTTYDIDITKLDFLNMNNYKGCIHK